jgi:hypothetical protein
VVPKERGGTDDDTNLQTSCRTAHQAKTDAEKRGLTWDEAAWWAGRSAGGGGGQMSGAGAGGTDRFVDFSRAQVL